MRMKRWKRLWVSEVIPMKHKGLGFAAPVVEVRLEYVEQSRTPAIAARPEPIAKVRAMVPLTLTPMS